MLSKKEKREENKKVEFKVSIPNFNIKDCFYSLKGKSKTFGKLKYKPRK